jgi:hypothetical protein
MVFQRSNRNDDEDLSEGDETPRQRRRREAELWREQSRLLAEEKRVARELAKREAQERRAESLKAKREADGREPSRWSFTISNMRSRPKSEAVEKPEVTKRARSNEENETSRSEKRGWVSRFSRSTRTNAAESSTSSSKSSHQQTTERRKNDSSRQSDQGEIQKREKTSWWSRKPKDLSLDMSAKPKSPTAPSHAEANEKKSQSPWLRNRFNKKQSAPDKPAAEVPKRSWFGFLDSLKLKPPNEPVEAKTKTTITRPTSAGASEPRPVAGSVNPSSRPIQNQPTSANRSSGSANYDEYEDDDRQDRQLSKAERKLLRRINDQNRAA